MYTDPYVKDWADINTSLEARVVKDVSGSAAMVVIDRTLVATGAVVDEICEMSTPFPDSRTLSDFFDGFNSSCQKLSQWLEDIKLSQNLFQIIFHAIIGYHALQSDVTAQTYLRRGFRSFMNFVRTVFDKVSAINEGKTVVMQSVYPQEYRTFLNLAQLATVSKRLSMTQNGFFGFTPNLAEIGDYVIRFKGCSIAFLARSLKQSATEMVEFQLIGPVYFCQYINGKVVTPELDNKEQKIILI